MDKNKERDEFYKSGGEPPFMQFIGIVACSCDSKKTTRIETSIGAMESYITCRICGNVYCISTGKLFEEGGEDEEKDD